MEAMNDWAGLFIQKEVRRTYSSYKAVLDVGAGWGKYRFLLPEYRMDACEIWQPYIEKDNLNYWYGQVFNKDICDFKFEYYDILIFGDVFEHIERERAKELLEYAWPRCEQMFISIPFQYQQGEVDGNIYETHLQADLTPELMAKEYPLLKLLKQVDNRAVYGK